MNSYSLYFYIVFVFNGNLQYGNSFILNCILIEFNVNHISQPINIIYFRIKQDIQQENRPYLFLLFNYITFWLRLQR